MQATINITDNEAVCKFEQTGDHIFFGIVYDRHGPAIREYLRRLTGDHFTADGLLQKVFGAVQRRESTFPGGSVRAWLHLLAFQFSR